jgi:putative transposase
MLATVKKRYDAEKKFPPKQELRKIVKRKGLYSQVAQELVDRLRDALKRKVRAKKEGKRCGFPRFKSFDRMKSLVYPQLGFSLGHKLRVTPFGELAIKKHREINGKIKTLTIKREPSGKWFAVFTVEEPKPEPKQNDGPAVGMDLGLMNFVVLSDGTKIKNPHHLKKWEDRLAFQQRRLSRKTKGSKNRQKARIKVARLHEKAANTRRDFLHKLSTKLVSTYSLIAAEKLSSQSMTMNGHGKNINDAAWGAFINMLCYKAEGAGSRVVFVEPENTSKICSRCGEMVEKTLWDRQHTCPTCGLSIDRDLNAAINILKRATAGYVGSNACGDGAVAPSQKQEAHPFQEW